MTVRRLLFTDILLVVFGTSSWLAVNGVWAELPLLVAALPEGWTLPSHLAVVVQLANVGPLIYAVLRYYCGARLADGGRRRHKLRRLEVVTVLTMLVVSAVACFLAAVYWRRTTRIWSSHHSPSDHSLALLSLVFCIALVDCTSSVVYVPFTARFQARYLVSYMVGEGLSGLLPSLVTLVQGIGGNSDCVNTTVDLFANGIGTTTNLYGNSTDQSVSYITMLESVEPAPRFSVGAFFHILGALTLASLVAFVFLLRLPMLDRSREPPPPPVLSSATHSPRVPNAISWSETLSISAANSSAQTTPTRTVTTPSHTVATPSSSLTSPITENTIAVSSRRIYLQLLLLQAILCAISNGLLPSLQTYSVLPYGNTAFHLVASLGLAANPAACLIQLWRPCRSLLPTVATAATSVLLTVFLIYTAAASPHPPLQHSLTGVTIIVLAWIIYSGLCTYSKVAIAGLLRPHGQRPLFWYGAATQMGSLLGAIVGYLAVNIYNLFTVYQPC